MQLSKQRDGVIGLRDFGERLCAYSSGGDLSQHGDNHPTSDRYAAHESDRALGETSLRKIPACRAWSSRLPHDVSEPTEARTSHGRRISRQTMAAVGGVCFWHDINPSNTPKKTAPEITKMSAILKKSLQLQVIERDHDVDESRGHRISTPFMGIGLVKLIRQ